VAQDFGLYPVFSTVSANGAAMRAVRSAESPAIHAGFDSLPALLNNRAPATGAFPLFASVQLPG
jgi:hypothetical protein